ncbi:MAG: hypothetical protein K9G72_20610 [Rhodobacteraceae bacterium]|nr:hypothetical protein [Paracoccaceae bacterium]MCF8521041.1 hypothetical protein [Paracoccaceae bacterium]
MTLYPARREIDLDLFRTDRPNTALYGLPQEVAFCTKCGVSNQRHNSAV